MTVTERLSDAGYAAGWQLTRALPQSVAGTLFRLGADVASYRGAGDGQLRKNLARVLGVPADRVPDAMVRDTLRSYARYWCEAFRLPSMDLAKLAEDIDDSVYDREYFLDAVDRGKGVVVAVPHSGNFDMAGVWVVQQTGPFSTVAERLKPESLFRRFVEYREALGFEVFPLTGGESPPFATLAERLNAGKVVCLPGERDLTRRGVPVEFFGETTQLPAGPAKLAIETGAALLPCHCWFTDDGWGFKAGEPIDTSGGVAATTQLLADRFAENIAAHPTNWHMLQPLWLSDLSESRRARLGAR